MECDIESEGDSPVVFSGNDRKAMKDHICGECGKTIKKGETYRYESGIWESGPNSYKTCMDCISVRNVFFCSFTYNQLWVEMRELVLNYDGEISEKKMRSITPAAHKMVCDIIDALEDGKGE